MNQVGFIKINRIYIIAIVAKTYKINGERFGESKFETAQNAI